MEDRVTSTLMIVKIISVSFIFLYLLQVRNDASQFVQIIAALLLKIRFVDLYLFFCGFRNFERPLFSRLMEVIADSTSSNALDDELFILRKDLSSVQMQKEHSKGNALVNLQNQEKEIKKQMVKVQKDISLKLRNASLADTLTAFKDNNELFEEPLFIKTLCQLIVFGEDVLILVVFKTETTDALISHIDELEKTNPIVFGQYVDYHHKKGLNYKVIYHE